MISVENLTKRYGHFTAVNDISFEVRPGSVVGFLGPNGAGKSTAMRMMTGLTPATSGRATILGREYRTLPNPARHVGVMLDASAQHPGRTGKEVLHLIAMQTGAPKTRVGEALELVGLDKTEAGRRVRNYSLGMRQRLGLAGALMGDPQVLILDEPANGLDPQGIHWMRQLLRNYADQGGTVLLSSHLLHEVQIIADDLVMIGRGKIVAQGTKEQLLNAQGTKVNSLDNDTLVASLRAADLEVTGDRHGLVVTSDVETVGRIALQSGVVLTELRNGGFEGLEEMFLSLTASDSREGVAA